MLYRSHLVEELQRRREDFLSFEREWRDEVSAFAERLRALSERGAEDVGRELREAIAPGAIPSAELTQSGALVLKFGERWRSHEEARRWALEVLHERVTFAADGSQLLPGREISLPVAAVQVAWFENPHTRAGEYRKQARLEIVTPADFLEQGDDRINAETVVGIRRTKLETEEAHRFFERQKGWRERGERPPLAFFDGSLLMSIGLPKTIIQEAYVNTMAELVTLSRETEVPVVGFIDQSYARDLVKMLNALDGTAQDGRQRAGARASALYDAQLLRAAGEDGQSLLSAWGDRTIFFRCRRENWGAAFSDEQGEPLVGFVYLQTTGDSAPARLDIPAWIYEAGLLDEVVDTVRAECVVGNGYPYAIETADEAAFISARDRQHFLRALQDFAEDSGLGFRLSRKAFSKSRRR